MKLFVSRRRWLAGALGLTALLAGSAILGPRIVRAFTLIPNLIFFDPVSLPVDHTLRVHFVNQMGTDPIDVRIQASPTLSGTGTPAFVGPITLNAGEGTDQAFTFASFSPPPGVTRIPLVVQIHVSPSPPGTPVHGLRMPDDWSGGVASSVELFSDRTRQQVLILGSRHIVQDGTGNSARFCLSCN
jgi:hypothetical protein